MLKQYTKGVRKIVNENILTCQLPLFIYDKGDVDQERLWQTPEGECRYLTFRLDGVTWPVRLLPPMWDVSKHGRPRPVDIVAAMKEKILVAIDIINEDAPQGTHGVTVLQEDQPDL